MFYLWSNFSWKMQRNRLSCGCLHVLDAHACFLPQLFWFPGCLFVSFVSRWLCDGAATCPGCPHTSGSMTSGKQLPAAQTHLKEEKMPTAMSWICVCQKTQTWDENIHIFYSISKIICFKSKSFYYFFILNIENTKNIKINK